MSDLRTAAQQALKALESLFTLQMDYVLLEQREDAITALRAALEQPEQEPVAWMTPRKDIITCNGAGTRFSDWTPLYTHPPRREWRGLTEEELRRLWRKSPFRGNGGQIDWFTEGARVAEAALKERNA